MYLGKHQRSVDQKGRLAFPANYRYSIGEVAYVAKSPGQSCLTVFLAEDFQDIISRLGDMLREDRDSLDEFRQFTSGATEVSFDSQGRMRLPKELLDAAEITDGAVVVGVGERIEIWNPDRWADVESHVAPDQKERWL